MAHLGSWWPGAGQPVDHPGDDAPDFEVGAARYFESRVSGVFRLEKDAPAPLDDLEAFEGKAISKTSHDDTIVGGGECPIDCNDVTVIDTRVAHGMTTHLHEIR